MNEVIFNQKMFTDNLSDLTERSPEMYIHCDFCTKEERVFRGSLNLLKKLYENDSNSYCMFCARNGYSNTNSKNNNILILSMRSLIGYLYYTKYKMPYEPIIQRSQLNLMIDNHIKIGYLNPVFKYDETSFCWFVDFSRVGNGPRKIDLSHVKNTISEMVTAFNVGILVKDADPYIYVNRFHDAIESFYHDRNRPKGRKLLIPTLTNCGTIEMKIGINKNATKHKTINHDDCKYFHPENLVKRANL